MPSSQLGHLLSTICSLNSKSDHLGQNELHEVLSILLSYSRSPVFSHLFQDICDLLASCFRAQPITLFTMTSYHFSLPLQSITPNPTSSLPSFLIDILSQLSLINSSLLSKTFSLFYTILPSLPYSLVPTVLNFLKSHFNFLPNTLEYIHHLLALVISLDSRFNEGFCNVLFGYFTSEHQNLTAISHHLSVELINELIQNYFRVLNNINSNRKFCDLMRCVVPRVLTLKGRDSTVKIVATNLTQFLSISIMEGISIASLEELLSFLRLVDPSLINFDSFSTFPKIFPELVGILIGKVSFFSEEVVFLNTDSNFNWFISNFFTRPNSDGFNPIPKLSDFSLTNLDSIGYYLLALTRISLHFELIQNTLNSVLSKINELTATVFLENASPHLELFSFCLVYLCNKYSNDGLLSSIIKWLLDYQCNPVNSFTVSLICTIIINLRHDFFDNPFRSIIPKCSTVSLKSSCPVELLSDFMEFLKDKFIKSVPIVGKTLLCLIESFPNLETFLSKDYIINLYFNSSVNFEVLKNLNSVFAKYLVKCLATSEFSFVKEDVLNTIKDLIPKIDQYLSQKTIINHNVFCLIAEICAQILLSNLSEYFFIISMFICFLVRIRSKPNLNADVQDYVSFYFESVLHQKKSNSFPVVITELILHGEFFDYFVDLLINFDIEEQYLNSVSISLFTVSLTKMINTNTIGKQTSFTLLFFLSCSFYGAFTKFLMNRVRQHDDLTLESMANLLSNIPNTHHHALAINTMNVLCFNIFLYDHSLWTTVLSSVASLLAQFCYPNNKTELLDDFRIYCYSNQNLIDSGFDLFLLTCSSFTNSSTQNVHEAAVKAWKYSHNGAFPDDCVSTLTLAEENQFCSHLIGILHKIQGCITSFLFTSFEFEVCSCMNLLVLCCQLLTAKAKAFLPKIVSMLSSNLNNFSGICVSTFVSCTIQCLGFVSEIYSSHCPSSPSLLGQNSGNFEPSSGFLLKSSELSRVLTTLVVDSFSIMDAPAGGLILLNYLIKIDSQIKNLLPLPFLLFNVLGVNCFAFDTVLEFCRSHWNVLVDDIKEIDPEFINSKKSILNSWLIEMTMLISHKNEPVCKYSSVLLNSFFEVCAPILFMDLELNEFFLPAHQNLGCELLTRLRKSSVSSELSFLISKLLAKIPLKLCNLEIGCTGNPSGSFNFMDNPQSFLHTLISDILIPKFNDSSATDLLTFSFQQLSLLIKETGQRNLFKEEDCQIMDLFSVTQYTYNETIVDFVDFQVFSTWISQITHLFINLINTDTNCLLGKSLIASKSVLVEDCSIAKFILPVATYYSLTKFPVPATELFVKTVNDLLNSSHTHLLKEAIPLIVPILDSIVITGIRTVNTSPGRQSPRTRRQSVSRNDIHYYFPKPTVYRIGAGSSIHRKVISQLDLAKLVSVFHELGFVDQATIYSEILIKLTNNSDEYFTQFTSALSMINDASQELCDWSLIDKVVNTSETYPQPLLTDLSVSLTIGNKYSVVDSIVRLQTLADKEFSLLISNDILNTHSGNSSLDISSILENRRILSTTEAKPSVSSLNFMYPIHSLLDDNHQLSILKQGSYIARKNEWVELSLDLVDRRGDCKDLALESFLSEKVKVLLQLGQLSQARNVITEVFNYSNNPSNKSIKLDYLHAKVLFAAGYYLDSVSILSSHATTFQDMFFSKFGEFVINASDIPDVEVYSKASFLLAKLLDRKFVSSFNDQENQQDKSKYRHKENIMLPEDLSFNEKDLVSSFQHYLLTVLLGSEREVESLCRAVCMFFRYRKGISFPTIKQLAKLIKSAINTLNASKWTRLLYQFSERTTKAGVGSTKKIFDDCIGVLIEKTLKDIPCIASWILVPLVSILKPSNPLYSTLTNNADFMAVMKFSSTFSTLKARIMDLKEAGAPTVLSSCGNWRWEPGIVAPLFKTYTNPSNPLYVSSVDDSVKVFNSVAKPFQLRLVLSDGSRSSIIVKPFDDLRLDNRSVSLVEYSNHLFSKSLFKKAQLSSAGLYPYAIIPIRTGDEEKPHTPNNNIGLIEAIPNVQPIRQLLFSLYTKHENHKGPESSWFKSFWSFFKNRFSQADGTITKDPRKLDELETLFKEIQQHFPPVFHRWFMENFDSIPHVVSARRRFGVSTALWCGVGYILGLGDRHLENILIANDGTCHHCDFNFLFNKGVRVSWPETVKFRLTNNIVDASGPFSIKQLIHPVMSKALHVLRANEDFIQDFLWIFLDDPLKERSIVDETLNRVRRRTKGYQDGLIQPVEAQVDNLIKEATNPRNLSQLWPGWMAVL
ncbi:hypothetical protein P9112_006663 [Eukaryota sp. TZLM1-RC]